MSSHLRIISGLTLVGVVCGTAVPASAQSQTQTFLDAQAGVGYSTNPELRVDGVGSGFGRVSLYGFHGWSSELSRSSVSAYVENSYYFRRYSNRQIFDLSAATSRQVSQTVRVFGDLGFSGDFGAQLSSRFFGAPADAVPLVPPPADNSVIIINPDLTALNQRQYRIKGRAGADVVLSARDSINATVGAQRTFFSSSNEALDYNYYDVTAGWQRQLNARAAVGLRVIGTYADYRQGGSIFSYGPQVTGSLQLSENVEAAGAIGVVRTEQDLGTPDGSDNSFDLAFDASLCRKLTSERLCARASRRTQSSVLGSAPTSSSFDLGYSRRVNARDQWQASLAVVSTSGERNLGQGRQTYFTLSTSYDRKFNDRVSAGASLVARKLYYSGPNPKGDFGGSLFIRTRFGDVR